MEDFREWTKNVADPSFSPFITSAAATATLQVRYDFYLTDKTEVVATGLCLETSQFYHSLYSSIIRSNLKISLFNCNL